MAANLTKHGKLFDVREGDSNVLAFCSQSDEVLKSILFIFKITLIIFQK